MAASDIQEIRVVAQKGDEKKKLFWLLRRGDDLYGNVYGMGFHYSRHETGEFHARDELASPGSELPVMILTTLWWKPRISEALSSGLQELFAHAIFYISEQDWVCYSDFKPKKKYNEVVEIPCEDVEELHLKVWLTDEHNAKSLQLNEGLENARNGLGRLASEIVKTGRGWLLLVEAYAPKVSDDSKDLPTYDLNEAWKLWITGQLDPFDYIRIRKKHGLA